MQVALLVLDVETPLETLDASGGIDYFLRAGVERMALGANLDSEGLVDG